MRYEVKLANLKLKFVWNMIFRTSYSPKLMRVLFDLLSGCSKEKLSKKFPTSTFETKIIEHIKTETISASSDFPTHTMLLYVHGGGYFMGSVDSYRAFALKLSFHIKHPVMLVNYRLAPENPYPAALDDLERVYKRLLDAQKDLVLGGDSAGGGLTMALILRLRLNDIQLPRACFVISPWLDLAGEQPSYDTNKDKDVWLSKKHTQVWSKLYLGQMPKLHALNSPILGDFKNMPPTAIFVGDQEVLRDESIKLYENFQKNQSVVKLFIAKDMQHNWMMGAPRLKESKDFFYNLKQFLIESLRI